jgi:hypothetical protein
MRYGRQITGNCIELMGAWLPRLQRLTAQCSFAHGSRAMVEVQAHCRALIALDITLTPARATTFECPDLTAMRELTITMHPASGVTISMGAAPALQRLHVDGHVRFEMRSAWNSRALRRLVLGRQVSNVGVVLDGARSLTDLTVQGAGLEECIARCTSLKRLTLTDRRSALKLARLEALTHLEELVIPNGHAYYADDALVDLHRLTALRILTIHSDTKGANADAAYLDNAICRALEPEVVHMKALERIVHMINPAADWTWTCTRDEFVAAVTAASAIAALDAAAMQRVVALYSTQFPL